jgi:predicted porin
MKHTILGLLIIFTFIGYSVVTKAQCSDAGACSVGGHSIDQENNSLINISASYKFGSSGKEDDVKYHSFQVGAVYNVLEKTSLQLSIPYNIQSGPLGDVNGIGDMLISVTQNLFSDESSTLTASLGAKIATGNDNKNQLPMAYQSGLGSNDLILAVNYSYNNIGLGAGYQLSNGRNKNLLKLKRGNDLLVRASYNLVLGEFTIAPQILFIKRLDKSNMVNLLAMGPTESFIDVENSDQTQINFLLQVQHQINSNFSVFADFAIPFLKRDVNVDGLTRSFSASIGVQLNIN